MYKLGEDRLLSERELEVLNCLRKGLSNPEIAKLLFITTSTVKAHISSLLQKLNAKNRIDALLMIVGEKEITNKLIATQINSSIKQ